VLQVVKLTTLVKTDDFSSVFSFRKRISADFLVVHYRPNSLALTRVGLAVTKKVANLAVHRNYMRRVLREISRQAAQIPVSMDLVIQVRKKFGRNEFDQVKTELLMQLKKIQARQSVG
jgi:ribonuclease P protein component